MNTSPPPFQLWRSRAPGRWLAAGIVLVTLAVSCAVSWPASATTPKALAKVEFDQAQIQYKLGHFEDALAGYSRAYEMFPAPAFLFNIGQCHKNLKNYERAIFFFEGYLREEKNPARRSLAGDLLAESRAELEKQQRAAAAPSPAASPPPIERGPAAGPAPALPPAPSPSSTTSGAAAPVMLAPAGATNDASIHATDERPVPLTHKWWFWTAIGAGVVGLAGSAIYLSSGGTTFVPPTGTIGTLDRR